MIDLHIYFKDYKTTGLDYQISRLPWTSSTYFKVKFLVII